MLGRQRAGILLEHGAYLCVRIGFTTTGQAARRPFEAKLNDAVNPLHRPLRRIPATAMLLIKAAKPVSPPRRPQQQDISNNKTSPNKRAQGAPSCPRP